jgi:hypothetical protein
LSKITEMEGEIGREVISRMEEIITYTQEHKQLQNSKLINGCGCVMLVSGANIRTAGDSPAPSPRRHRSTGGGSWIAWGLLFFAMSVI